MTRGETLNLVGQTFLSVAFIQQIELIHGLTKGRRDACPTESVKLSMVSFIASMDALWRLVDFAAT